jgi:hypothetical protein
MHVELRECDDWIVVYKNGKRVWENHSCDLASGLEALGIAFVRTDLYDIVDDLGAMPDGSNPFPEEIPHECSCPTPCE